MMSGLDRCASPRMSSSGSGSAKSKRSSLGAPGATPLLFVHGLSYFSYDWLEVAQALAADREAVCMDMRGFGDSEWSAARDYSVPTMAADIAHLLDHLGWPRAIVFGHSMGGRSAAYFAAKNPSRAAGLVLVDYSPDNAPAGAKRTAETVGGTPDAFASVDEAMRYFKAAPDRHARFEAYLAPAPGGLEGNVEMAGLGAARRLVAMGAEIALVTLGEYGVCYASSETSGRIPALRTTIQDPTGAGNALTAVAIFALLNEISLDDAVRLGVSAATLTLRHSGAVVPDLSLDKLYDQLVI